MNWRVFQCVLCALCFVGYLRIIKAQRDERPNRFMEEDDLILFNVAVKGRVVELLANEIARTEIIRALLYEYAKECVQNITLMEKSCFNCMMERCENRLAHCNIKDVRLSEVISHSPSPIKGLQFLSQAPKKVTTELKDFADNARADILRDVPDKLRGEGEKIVHSEVDESLTELRNNMNTEKTLQKITIHFQKAANNIHILPDLGEKLATLVVENRDRAVNVAELLASKLRGARPYLKSMQHNGERVKEKAPGIMTKLGQTVSAFKDRMTGVLGAALDSFQQALDNPDTTVIQGNPQQFNVVAGSVMGNQPAGQPVRSQFQSDFGPISRMQFQILHPNEARQILRRLEVQVSNQLQGLRNLQGGGQITPQQFLGNNPQMQANAQLMHPGNGNPGQGHLPAPMPQHQMLHNVPQNPTQFPQSQQMPQPMPPIPPSGSPMNQPAPQQTNSGGVPVFQGQGAQGQPMPQGQVMNNQFVAGQNMGVPQSGQFSGQPTAGQNMAMPQSGQFSGQQNAQGQQQMGMMSGGQGQPMPQGRRRRQIEPECGKLKYDPETYCKTYESQCHNCTLEKKLRFEVCGEGVEKARDEIKRLDNSVQSYLEAYENYVADGPLVLKVELNDTHRLSKTNTYYDAYITAKIGAAIIRYKTKMILNVNDLHVAGSQIGDEIWEKLWEQNVFSEADRLDIVHNEDHGDMGQLHKFNVKIDKNTKSQAQKSSAGSNVKTVLSFILGITSTILFFL